MDNVGCWDKGHSKKEREGKDHGEGKERQEGKSKSPVLYKIL